MTDPAPASGDAAWKDMLTDVLGQWGPGEPDVDDVLKVLAEHRPFIEAALTPPLPAEPTLDVERLTDALHLADLSWVRDYGPEATMHTHELARRAAAEYAALREAGA